MSYFGELSSARLQVFAGAIAAMSAFSTDKANQEFELKFTAPAALLLDVAELIAKKTAVYVQLGANLAAARQDIVRAISIDPAHAEAVLESGILMRLAGDNDKARQEWLKLIELHEGSPAAETATRNLEILDINSQ